MPSQHPEARKLISQGVFDSIKSFKDFEGRVTKLIETNTTLGGDAFEIFVEAYLINQPKMQCAKVFVVKQLPLDISKELNLPNDGKGVDGVYKSFSEISVPYQVKFRSNRPPLSLTEVATFLGLTERAKDRVLITNCDEIARDVKNRDYLRSIRGQDFDLLEEADFKLIEAWLKEKPVKRELPKPRPYQEAALKDIKNTLTTHDRATAVMACGTGKTLIALWAAQQAEANTVLVLLPSLTLMQQTLLEWSKNNSWGNRFSFICVCSDPTVKANDEIEIDSTDIDFKVDTDPELVKEFLSQKNEKVKVVFSTYQSSKIVGEAVKGLSPFDFAVFDEAHKTTGPKGGVFAFALDDKNISIKKRLFLTATPRHYDIKKRDKEGEFKVISMDDESIYGPRAHSLTFGSAANQGIICNYKVIISLIDKNQVDDFALKNGITLIENDKIGTRWVASQIALQQAIEKVNASKIITFHSRVKLAQEFSSEKSHGIKRYLKDFKVMHVNGEQRSNERTDLIRQFKDSPKSLITNARCLTEGVDVPAVDMVAFIDPRQSRVDITQAVGRAMRKPKNSQKLFGYILVPIFANTNDPDLYEDSIKKEGYENIKEVLNSLREQDEDLADIIKEAKENIGEKNKFDPSIFREKIEVIGPLINIDSIRDNICLELVNSLGASWNFYYGLLKKYYKEFQTSRMPNLFIYEDVNLGSWCSEMRYIYNLYKNNYQKYLLRGRMLSEERIKKLENLPDWTWNQLDENWNQNFEYLKKYIEENHDSFMSARYVIDGKKVGIWLSNQRSYYKNKLMEQDKIALFESLPFWVWDFTQGLWDKGYQYLIEYQKEFGTPNVPARLTYKGYSLGGWVSKQRADYRKNKLDEGLIKKLELVRGWSWSRLDDMWKEGVDHLLNYVSQYKTTKVPPSFKINNFNLSSWIKARRQNYRNNMLNESQVNFLQSLPDWSWNTWDDYWKQRINELREYSKKFDHLIVTKDYKSADGKSLLTWINTQRKNYKNKILTIDQIKELESIPDWKWSSNEEDPWDIAYKALINFKNTYGHINITKKTKFEGINLGYWISTQRKLFKSNKLSQERIEKLASINNWKWNISEDSWTKAIQYLEKYIADYGHCEVPIRYLTPDTNYSLGSWVNHQRRDFKNKLLTEEQISQLESLSGWKWNVVDDKWESFFELLKYFSEKHGNCELPRNYKVEGKNVYAWANRQKNYYKTGRLNNLRINKLESLSGWNWKELETNWNNHYDALVEYVRLNRSISIPRGYVVNGLSLGAWAQSQRSLYNKKLLSEDRINLLEKIEIWSWNISDEEWQKGFSGLQKFVEEFGHCRVPKDYISNGIKLALWIGTKRTAYRRNKLSEERIANLESINGWFWNKKN